MGSACLDGYPDCLPFNSQGQAAHVDCGQKTNRVFSHCRCPSTLIMVPMEGAEINECQGGFVLSAEGVGFRPTWEKSANQGRGGGGVEMVTPLHFDAASSQHETTVERGLWLGVVSTGYEPLVDAQLRREVDLGLSTAKLPPPPCS